MTFGDVRRALGLSKQRATVIVNDRRFPSPWYAHPTDAVRLWLRADVESWLDANRPGWRAGG